MTDALAINLEAACWYFKGAKDSHGYGAITVRGKQTGAHRYMWTVMRGPIPRGLELHHLCGTRDCVNPLHMELVNRLEHKRRHRVTHCKYGHELDDQNTYVYSDGHRECRACHRAYYHAHKHLYPSGQKAGKPSAQRQADLRQRRSKIASVEGR